MLIDPSVRKTPRGSLECPRLFCSKSFWGDCKQEWRKRNISSSRLICCFGFPRGKKRSFDIRRESRNNPLKFVAKIWAGGAITKGRRDEKSKSRKVENRDSFWWICHFGPKSRFEKDYDNTLTFWKPWVERSSLEISNISHFGTNNFNLNSARWESSWTLKKHSRAKESNLGLEDN